ncbi:MAG: response regulator [Ignavibacteriae bacterium]|nr:response regulator [Ignavibacteria bacterium]MBI3365410.1 response regulator [Ignavibacteriota bacterium]
MKKTTLLYVDDEQGALETLKMGLEAKGYAVLTAASGPDALDLLKNQSPDIIVADLRMQPMNGFELYQAVKRDTKFARTPFLFLTAVDDFLAQKYGQTLGVDAYIVKPFDIDNLDSIIRRKLSKT